MKTVITTSQAPAAIGPYSQAIVAGELIFCSGQIPLDPDSGKMIGTTAAEQAIQAFKNLEGLLGACGSSLAQVVKTTLFLVSMDDFGPVNEVYSDFFPEKPPARSTVAVAALPRGAKVEVEAIALKAPSA